MPRVRNFLIILALCALAAWAEQVMVQPAQLSGPFGTDTGKLVMVGDRMIFVNDVNPNNSFVIPRSTISNLNWQNGMMTINLVQPFTAASGTGPSLVVRLYNPATPGAVANWVGIPLSTTGEASRVAIVSEGSFQFSVSHEGHNGRLVVGSTGVSYQDLKDSDESRSWSYSEIKEVKRDDNDITVKPHHGDAYKFRVLEGRAAADNLYNLLTDRVSARRH